MKRELEIGKGIWEEFEDIGKNHYYNEWNFRKQKGL